MLALVSNKSSFWTDIAVPLAAVVVGGTIAAFWPWIQTFQRGRRFGRLIRRELAELAPYPATPVSNKPWWEHAQKRFVHEEFFRQSSIGQNRDFLLGLNPTVVYQVSQLWIALERRDGRQWVHYLGELGKNNNVGGEKLCRAYRQWLRIMAAQRNEWREPMGSPSAFRQQSMLARVPGLFERRFTAYARLLPFTDFGTDEAPNDLIETAKGELGDKLQAWFYKEGGGLLLSGRALEQLQKARRTLADENADPAKIRDELSRLRTDLKIDLGVRQPQERDVAMAWPEEERW